MNDPADRELRSTCRQPGAGAATVGVSMQSFDDNFQTLLRNYITARAAKLEGVDVQLEELLQRDVGKQLSQVNNFIASGVDAIIVTLTDTSTAPAITSAAEAAGIPARLPRPRAHESRGAARQRGLRRFEGDRGRHARWVRGAQASRRTGQAAGRRARLYPHG